MKQEMSLKSKDNKSLILPSFLDKFDVLFNDEEYGFKADDKLLSLVMASLRLENLYNQEVNGICERGVILKSIYFIHEGKVDITYEPPK